MSTSKDAKYRDTDGKWGCLGCGFTLYPSGAEVDYCANVRCLLRHPHAAGSKDVRRLVERVLELEDSIRLSEADNDVARSFGRNTDAARIADEIRARRGDDWNGADV